MSEFDPFAPASPELGSIDSYYTSPFQDTGAVSKLSFQNEFDPLSPIGSGYESPFSFVDSNEFDPFAPTPQSKVGMEDPFKWKGQLQLDPNFKSADQTIAGMTQDSVQRNLGQGGGLFGEVPYGKAPWEFAMGALTAPTFSEAGKYGVAGVMNNITPKQFAERSMGPTPPGFEGTKEPIQKIVEFGSYFLDPIQNLEAEYLGPIVGNTLGAGVKAAGRGLESLAMRDIPYLSAGLKGTGEIFSRTWAKTPGQKALINILDEAAHRRGSNLIDISQEAGIRNTVVEDVAKKYGLNRDALNKQLSDLIELKLPDAPPISVDVTSWKYPDANFPDVQVKDGFIKSGQHNDEFIDPSPIPLTDIPITRTEDSEALIPNFSEATQGTYFSVGEGSNSIYNMTRGSNVFEGKVSPKNPLIIVEGGGGASEAAIQRLEGPDYYKLINDNIDFFKAQLQQHLGVDEFNKLDNILAKQAKEANWWEDANTLGMAYDRLGNQLAKDAGYDSILALDKQGLGEIAMLQPAEKTTIQKLVSQEAQPSVKAIQERAKYLTGDVIPDELAQVAVDQKLLRNKQWAEGNQAGLATPELKDIHHDYILHSKTDDAIATLKKYRPSWFEGRGGRAINPVHNSQLARQLDEYSIAQINEMGQKGTIPGLEGIKFDKFLEDNPVKLEAFREIKDQNALMDLRVLDQAAQKLGLDASSAPSHWIKLDIANSKDARLSKIVQRFENLRFEPEVAADLNKAITLNRLPDTEAKMLQYWDETMNVWRGLTLNFSPSYISRNVVGNLYNNALAGVRSKWYGVARDFQGGGWKRVVDRVNGEDLVKWEKQLPEIKGLKLNGQWYPADTLREMMKDYGVTSGGFITTETHGLMNELEHGKLFNATDIPGIGRIAKKSQYVNKLFEDNARMAHFFDRLDKGDTPLQAAASVEKYLFNYMNGLTPTMKAARRYAMPFVAWTRFNIPLQVQSVLGLTNTMRPLVRLTQLTNVIRSDEAVSKLNKGLKKLTPEYITQNWGIPVREGENGVIQFFLLGGWIPAGDLEQLTTKGGALDKAISMMNPILKEAAQQYVGVDEYTGQKLEGNKMFLGANMPYRLQHFLKNLAPLSIMDRLLQGEFYTDPGKLSSTQKTRLQKTIQFLFGLTTSNVDYRAQRRINQKEQRDARDKYRAALRKGDKSNADYWKQKMLELK